LDTVLTVGHDKLKLQNHFDVHLTWLTEVWPENYLSQHRKNQISYVYVYRLYVY